MKSVNCKPTRNFTKNDSSKLKNIPLLVVIGEKDIIVGVDEAQEIYRAVHNPKTLLVIDSADHIYKGKETELISKTVDWIKAIADSI